MTCVDLTCSGVSRILVLELSRYCTKPHGIATAACTVGVDFVRM